MATLLITSAGFQGRVIKLKLGTNRIGRAPDNDVQIEHPTISATHCEIEVQSDSLILCDCDSTNGTFINRGKRLPKGTRQPLRDGDEIIVGKTFLRFHIVK